MGLMGGYKKTDLGSIPDDWEVRKLEDHFSIYAGGDAPRSALSAVQSDQFPYAVYANAISDHGLYGYTDRYRCKGNAVTVTARGYLGHAEYRREPFFPIVRLLVMEPTGSLDAEYTTYFINERVRFAYESTGVPQLTAPQVARYAVASPAARTEQRAIATALGDVDALLDALDKLTAKKRDLKQAAMQQLLTGRTRLPGFTGEWHARKIGDFTTCTAGGTPSTAVVRYWGGSIPWMNSGELNLKHVYEVEGRITEEGVKSSSTKAVPAGCVLVGLAGQGKTRGTVAMNYVELCTNQSIAAIFPNDSFSSEFLYQDLDSRYDELRELSSGGGGRGGLNLTLIRGLEVPFPSLREQTAIAIVLSDMDAEIATLEARRAKTRDLKQAMTQELLTGRVRLVKPGSPYNAAVVDTP